jgi:hypothetical protein
MNTLFADEVKLAKGTSAGSIPFEAAVARVNALDWRQIGKDLDEQGSALLPSVLSADECKAVASLYPEESIFRSRVVMGRHGFGRGEYKYFNYPLLPIIHGLRTALYPQLAPVANRWNEAMGIEVRSREPRRFRPAMQRRRAIATHPAALAVRPGDYNCLHQDLYGEHVFPIQVAILLSEPQRDFTGGEFVLTEQRPRMQSRPEVVSLHQGDAVAFAVHHRPVQGTRGTYRVNLRHGVSRLRSGQRYTVGIIFHDAN